MIIIGLISGTSVDGIDAALVDITGREEDLHLELLAGETYPYPSALRERILAVCGGESLSVAELAELDDAIATQFALAAREIQIGKKSASLIGSHGQTVYHRPPLGRSHLGYSVQLGRGELIAELSGIPTVSNFRAADIAACGQGAPLVSKVDIYLLGHLDRHRCIQNVGGIGNVTYLPARREPNWESMVCGWDTGPGNALLDLAVAQLTSGRLTYDKGGSWAARGTPCQELVKQWLALDYFLQAPPKSTGRELFGKAYLASCFEDARARQLSDADLLATLTELTAASIVYNYQNFLPQMPDEVILCGGGSHNLYLKERLQANLNLHTRVLTTDEVGMSADFKEAIAFATLAHWRFNCNLPGNFPPVTGAKKAMLLGEIHLPCRSSIDDNNGNEII